MTRISPALGAALGASLLLGACSAFAPPVPLPSLTPPPMDAPPAWLAPPVPDAAPGNQAVLLNWWQQSSRRAPPAWPPVRC
jgi:hypothetical protein